MPLKKSRRRKRRFEIETIAEEFLDSASRDQYALRVVVFEDVERQYKRIEEFGDESIVGWRCEGEEVDGAVLFRVGGDGACEAAGGGGDGD